MKLDPATRAAVERLAAENGIEIPGRAARGRAGRAGALPGVPAGDAGSGRGRAWALRPAAEHGGARFVVQIDGWHPVRTNRLLNSHHMVAARLKAGDAEIVASAAWAAGVTAAAGRRRVTVTIVLGPGQRGGDPDSAYQKSLYDALKRAGVIRDDNRQWLEPEKIRYTRAEVPATVLVIEDVVAAKVRKGKDANP